MSMANGEKVIEKIMVDESPHDNEVESRKIFSLDRKMIYGIILASGRYYYLKYYYIFPW